MPSEAISIPKTVSFSKGTIFPIKERLTIGRKKTNMIIISDPYVSARHAVLFINEEQLFLRDLGSSNGTKYNNNIVSEDVLLNIGDKIKIGNLILMVI